MPIVSIIMPVYNGANFLNEAINSILSQSFDNFELIIIDDASSDLSKQIVLNYTDPRIRFIGFSKRKGLVYSLNYGVEISRGKYIARMDADDIALPNRIELQVRYLERNSDIDICGTWMYRFGGNKEEIVKGPSDSEAVRICLFLENVISHPTVMGKREAFLEYPYNSDNNAEDYELWVRMSTSKKISNIPKILVQYREHKQNTSNINRDALNANVNNIRIEQLNELGVEYDESEKKIHLSNLCEISYSRVKPLQLLRWIIKIIRVNRISKKYSEPLFSEIMLTRYITILYYSIAYEVGKKLRQIINVV